MVSRYTKKVFNNADIRERHFKTRHHYDPTRKEGMRTTNIDVSRGLKMSIYQACLLFSMRKAVSDVST